MLRESCPLGRSPRPVCRCVCGGDGSTFARGPQEYKSRGAWVVQFIKHPTLSSGSAHDLRLVRSSPASGSTLSGEFACGFSLPLAHPPTQAQVHTLSKRIINKPQKKKKFKKLPCHCFDLVSKKKMQNYLKKAIKILPHSSSTSMNRMSFLCVSQNILKQTECRSSCGIQPSSFSQTLQTGKNVNNTTLTFLF